MAELTRTELAAEAAEPDSQRQATQTSPESGVGELAKKRARSREYVRQWRAKPENQKHERIRSTGTKWNQKIERLKTETRVDSDEKCAYCGLDAVMKVKRMRMTADGFVLIEVLYCGSC